MIAVQPLTRDDHPWHYFALEYLAYRAVVIIG